ncbi:MAG TPA: NYN domain-containing protein [Solirubrobacteraceae bacterium]|jgi:predicted RNA-binding protein with PIN domain
MSVTGFLSARWRIRLPAVHYLIDAMNVIATRGDGWWRDRQRAMSDLVGLLDRWSTQNAQEVTVVFEGPPSKPIRSELIEVSHAPKARRDSADEEIVRRLGAESDPGEIVVVTSDRALAERVRALGATVRSASAFRGELDAL